MSLWVSFPPVSSPESQDPDTLPGQGTLPPIPFRFSGASVPSDWHLDLDKAPGPGRPDPCRRHPRPPRNRRLAQRTTLRRRAEGLGAGGGAVCVLIN